ncbi:MAG: uracil-DNA glycosylase [Planctomycetota bacterium]|nr:MAG: uracil-DNA glycosylase [Planctomycetota bacterium]
MSDRAANIGSSRVLVETDRFLGIDDVLLASRNSSVKSQAAPEVKSVALAVAVTATPYAPIPSSSIPVETRRVTVKSSPVPIVLPVGNSADERLAALARLHQTQCPLCTSSASNVCIFGSGSASADVLFVGEVPTEAEELAVKPLAGKSGEKLDEMIRAMKLQPAQIYIANILKCRLAGLRAPSAEEIAECAPYLRAQIEIIRPKVIVALGGPAAKYLLDTELGITRLRGTWGACEVGGVSIPVMPTFHPAYLLRNYTDEIRGAVWNDLKQVIERLRESTSSSITS